MEFFKIFGILFLFQLSLLSSWKSCLCNAVIIKDNTHVSTFAPDNKVLEEPEDQMQLVLNKAVARPSTGCYCLNDTCACCEHLDIPRFHINDTGCIEIVYLRKEYGLSLLLLVDGFVLINRTVSVHNPPPVCYAVPKVSAANLCLQFIDLHIRNKLLSGCVRVIAEISSVEIMKRDIGCFRFPVYFEEAFRARTDHLIQQKEMWDAQLTA